MNVMYEEEKIMKKVLSILLCLALLLSCAAAIGEAAEKTNLGSVNVNGDFTLQCAMPEGYSLKVTSSDNMGVSADLTSEDETKPILRLVLGFSDIWSDYERLNDVPEDELKEIEDSFYEEGGPDTKISYTETEHGTKLLIARMPDDSVGAIYSMYKGYEVEFTLVPAEGQTLTDEQFDLCVKFLSDLDFVEAQ